MIPDWLILKIEDRGRSQDYRFLVEGENLNFPHNHPDRFFNWRVQDVRDPRYAVHPCLRDESMRDEIELCKKIAEERKG